jgi:hypothetical protein
VIPDWVLDVLLLFPLTAVGIGTALQSRQAYDDYRDLLPPEDVFLRSASVSKHDARVNLANFISLPKRGRHAGQPSDAVKALRTAQAWRWLEVGAFLGIFLQMMRIIDRVENLSLGGSCWRLAAGVFYVGGVIIRAILLTRRPELRPTVPGQRGWNWSTYRLYGPAVLGATRSRPRPRRQAASE